MWEDEDIWTQLEMELEMERGWEKAQRLYLERCDRESRAKWILVVMAALVVITLALVWVRP